MLISEKRRNTPKLSREIMGLLCITAAIALFFFGFLYLTANAIASTYLLENDILLTEGVLPHLSPIPSRAQLTAEQPYSHAVDELFTAL